MMDSFTILLLLSFVYLIILYVIGLFLKFKEKVILMTGGIDSILVVFYFMFLLVLASGDSTNNDDPLMILYVIFLVVNLCSAYLLYKNYKKKNVSSNSIELLDENNNLQSSIPVNKSPNGDYIKYSVLVVIYFFATLLTSFILFPDYVDDLVLLQIPIEALVGAVVFSIIFYYLWNNLCRNLKKKITYPILFLIASKIFVLFLSTFINIDVIRVIYGSLCILDVIAVFSLYFYYSKKEKLND